MNLPLILAFLFFIGSVLGWVLELFFRRFISKNNPERKWINPGFCVGPWVPLYGFGLCLLYLLARLEQYNFITNPILNKIVLFALMALVMTVLEYIAGILLLKIMHVRLWDYSKHPGNIQGLVCPLFSLFWTILGAIYYFLVDPHVLDALDWLSQNLAFSFFIGLFFGVFIIDAVYSSNLIVKVRSFANEKGITVAYENLREQIARSKEARSGKRGFFFRGHSAIPLREQLENYLEATNAKWKANLEEQSAKFKAGLEETNEKLKASNAKIKSDIEERNSRLKAERNERNTNIKENSDKNEDKTN